MNERQKNFLKSLVNTPAPSGYEDPVQEIWKKEVSSFCKDIRRDIHGSLTAVINAGKDKSLMIVGHSDEVGLIVNYINDDGFIYVRPIGGIDHNILPSQRARILTKTGYVDAIIARTSLHLLNKEKLKKKNELHEIWLDIGAKNKKDAEKYINVGDPVIFGGDYMELQNGTAVARCWDNRVGIYIVAETLRNISKVKKLNHTVYGVSSVQEETGVWGAANPAYT
ncbi:MAG: M42 family peptidase, partial [Ignavibacteria bacterium]|nr:M42 family peptidase [Ignavibacteria bacterium]